MAQVNFRMDDNIKSEAEALFDSLGLNLGTAFNIFVRQALIVGGLPFDVKKDPFYNDRNMKALQKSLLELRKGDVVIKSMDDLQKMADE